MNRDSAGVTTSVRKAAPHVMLLVFMVLAGHADAGSGDVIRLMVPEYMGGEGMLRLSGEGRSNSAGLESRYGRINESGVRDYLKLSPGSGRSGYGIGYERRHNGSTMDGLKKGRLGGATGAER